MKPQDFAVLIVDDDLAYAETCARALAGGGFSAEAVGSSAQALSRIGMKSIDLVLTDLRMPEMDGLQLLRRIRIGEHPPDVIMMTGFGSIDSAVQAMKEGALDYITKPFDRAELLCRVRNAYDRRCLRDSLESPEPASVQDLKYDGYLFKSPLMQRVYARVRSAARCDCSVLITGESGSGKELIARAIHENSRRCEGAFVALNCGALSGELIESELFGYRKGAFTGADRDRQGLFAAASGGTLFLDEFVEMDPATQSKLLRAIQERKIRPVGAVEETRVDVRFVAATNCSLARALEEKRLREDLYHRLNVIPIEMPPLRKMRDEIPELLHYLLASGAEKHGHRIETLDDHALECLISYKWPGNIREAENLIDRLMTITSGDVIHVADLPKHVVLAEEPPGETYEPVPSFSDAERDLIVRALRQARGNKTKAADILGISRPRLYKKIERYGISE